MSKPIKRCRKPANAEVGRCVGAKKNTWIKFLRAYQHEKGLANFGLALLESSDPALVDAYNHLKQTPGALDEYIRDYDGGVPGYEPNVPKRAKTEEQVEPYKTNVRPITEEIPLTEAEAVKRVVPYVENVRPIREKTLPNIDPYTLFLNRYSKYTRMSITQLTNKKRVKNTFRLYEQWFDYATQVAKDNNTTIDEELYDNTTWNVWLEIFKPNRLG